jgi:flavin reductase (DIM6/NTAB) family NADH-FMN oxidoreductase RutF
MIIDLDTLDGIDRYKLAIGSVIPRPIAWVSSRNMDGKRNLAPYSFFTVACNTPLIFGIFAQRNTIGKELKDTAKNIMETGEAVIHIARHDQLEALNATASTLPYGEDEFDLAGLKSRSATRVKADIIEGGSIAFECVLYKHLTLGSERGGSEALFLEALVMHIDDALLDNFRIDHHALNPISKLAGPYYATIGQEIELQRPK